MFFFLALIIITSLLVFIITLVQAVSPNIASGMPSSQQIHYAFNNNSIPCSSGPFATYQPLRYEYTTDTTQSYRYYYCPWPTTNTWWRGITSLVVPGVVGFLLDRLRRRTPASASANIWNNPKRVMKFLLVPVGACAFAIFLPFVIDCAAVSSSNNFCQSLLSGSSNGVLAEAGLLPPITCDYVMFDLVIVLQLLILLFLGVVAILILVRNKFFVKYMQLEDEDEYDLGDLQPRFRSRRKETAN